jgi:hypothetical protein
MSAKPFDPSKSLFNPEIRPFNVSYFTFRISSCCRAPCTPLPTLVYSQASVTGSPLPSCGPSHSCGAVRSRYIACKPAYSQSSLYSTMGHAITTPLFLITSLQPLCFHVIAHSFPQRSSAIRRAFNNLRTLSIATAGGTPLPSSPKRLASRIATWTPGAHPTIIAASARFQVHG